MKRSVLILPFGFLFASVASAGAPSVLNFTGTLTDTAGEPAADDSYDLVFRIYDASTGGVELWSEDDTVDTEGGVFSIELGQVTTISPSLFQDNDALYLELEVEGDVLDPRFAIASVPWALEASHAAEADGLSCSGCVGSAEIATGAINSAELADGAVDVLDLADGVALAELLDNDGATSGLDCDLFDGLDSAAFAAAIHTIPAPPSLPVPSEPGFTARTAI